MQIDYNRRYLLDTFIDRVGNIQKLYLIKTLNKSTNQDNYYLKIYLQLPSYKEILQGYLYFFIISKEQKSKYVGTYIEPSSRNLGLASLLTSIWIKFCLDNDLEVLLTNRKQEKPFLLYLLKKYYFEINNPEIYPLHENTVYICNTDDNQKTLFFNSENLKKSFLKSNNFRKDNYRVIDSMTPDISILDCVILNKIYTLTDNEDGYKKAEKVYKKYKNN